METWFQRLIIGICLCVSELHAGRAGPRVRAEDYYQPAGFAGRVFLLRALGPHQARSRPAQYLIVLSL